ncbi:hypothetical protein Glove_551g46 [Diversispora epigaea]|uniref:Uncharacterized protein n=1 Tax=Diversispora epigaea TaxID=1348612 RepID=A0A397GF46_9GLOM|nr:hypothetical protein Glove_551g46 [Diversispora epigaea]
MKPTNKVLGTCLNASKEIKKGIGLLFQVYKNKTSKTSVVQIVKHNTLTHFKNNFDKWTSKNAHANDFFKWIDGYICNWDIKNKQWKRYGQVEVMIIYLRTINDKESSFLFYGITNNEYMMVLEYFLIISSHHWTSPVSHDKELAFNICNGFRPTKNSISHTVITYI